MQLRLQKFSYRFAEQVLNSKLAIKQEIEEVLLSPKIDVPTYLAPISTIYSGFFLLIEDGKMSLLFSMNLVIPPQGWIS